MPSVIGNAICITLSILSIVSAVPLVVSHVPATQEGPIRIVNCGPRTKDVEDVLRLLPGILQPAIEDASRFVASNAYMTFFKTIAHASHVREVLLNVSVGAPVPANVAGASPSVFCVMGPGQVWGINDQIRQDYYTRYLSDRRPAGAYVGIRDAPFVFLYPDFGDFPSVPSASPGTCLTVLPHFNRYKQNGKDFSSYQLWILLHELVHLYAYDPSTKALEEVGDVNDCVGLPASKAVLNAQSYVYYVANIYMKCTHFPTLSRPEREVELLQVNQTTTISNSSGHELPRVGHKD